MHENTAVSYGNSSMTQPDLISSSPNMFSITEKGKCEDQNFAKKCSFFSGTTFQNCKNFDHTNSSS